MSAKIKKQRAATNAADSATLTLNERILKECHDFYMDPKNGLAKLASDLKKDLLAPRKKITVLLIGNHSSGKSSFINWYIEEHILKTGVAIETQGFVFVTSGKKRETLTGNATLHLYPHFKPLSEIKGLIDYVTTEISTSKQKKFSLVTFIDTPGLVDGEMNYPFDVEKAIKFLGNLADLIFVFFDPIGQALCKRTLNVVDTLTAKHGDKIKLFLSKADEAGNETDRQKVLMQIVQELCKRPGLNRAGFDLSTIYIPNPNKPVRCVNQIEEACKEIEKTINRTVQNTLNTLESDCTKIEDSVNDILKEDEDALMDRRFCNINPSPKISKKNRKENIRSSGKGVLLGLLGFTLPFLFVTSFVISSASKSLLESLLGKSLTELLKLYVRPLETAWVYLPEDTHLFVIIFVVVLSCFLLFLAYLHIRLKKTLTRKQKNILLETKEYVTRVIKCRKKQLYDDYLRQSVAEHEL